MSPVPEDSVVVLPSVYNSGEQGIVYLPHLAVHNTSHMMFELQQYETSPAPRMVQACPICYPQTATAQHIEHGEHCVIQTARDCVSIVHPIGTLTDASFLLKRIEEIEQRLTATRESRPSTGHVKDVSPPRVPSPLEIQRISTSQRESFSPSPAHYGATVLSSDESTRIVVARHSVDRSCGDSPPVLASPEQLDRHSEVRLLLHVLEERRAGFDEITSAMLDTYMFRKSDLWSTSTRAVVSQMQEELMIARRAAERVRHSSQLSLFMATITRLEELATEHYQSVSNLFEQSIADAAPPVRVPSVRSHSSKKSRSPDTREAVCAVGPTALSTSLRQTPPTATVATQHEDATQRISRSSMVDSVVSTALAPKTNSGGLQRGSQTIADTDFELGSVQSDDVEPIEPRPEQPQVPTPRSIQTRLPVRPHPVTDRRRALQRQVRRHPSISVVKTKAVLQPPWNSSTSVFEGSALPKPQRSFSAPRREGSYAANFASTHSTRSRLGVEEPTSSFLESATPRYQVRFAGACTHTRHTRCQDHWCEDLDLH